MRFNVPLVLIGSSVSVIDAFAPQATQTQSRSRVPILHATKPSNNENIVVDTLEAIDATVKGAVSGMALAAALWMAPATLAGPMTSAFPNIASNNDVIASSIASAKEKASGSGTRVNKDPESLLRYGLPINNKEVSIVHCVLLQLILNITKNMICLHHYTFPCYNF